MRFLIPRDFMEDPVRGIICVAFRLWIVAVVVALLAAIAKAEPARVVRILDGDTIKVDRPSHPTTTVRLLELDTPEKDVRARCPQERAMADAATEFARALMPYGKEIDLRLNGKLDVYGRSLGAVIIDGRDYATMVREAGLGVVWRKGIKTDWCR